MSKITDYLFYALMIFIVYAISSTWHETRETNRFIGQLIEAVLNDGVEP